MNVSTAEHSYTRINVLSQILASQIASVMESGNLGQLLWHDPLKQTQMIWSVKNSACFGSMWWCWDNVVHIFTGSTPFGAVVWLRLQLCIQTMSLRYFSPVSADQKLPDPQGVIARDVLSSSISAANTEAKCMESEQQKTSKSKRESYASSQMYKGWDSKQAAENRIASTIHYFAEKESSICTSL